VVGGSSSRFQPSGDPVERRPETTLAGLRPEPKVRAWSRTASIPWERNSNVSCWRIDVYTPGVARLGDHAGPCALDLFARRFTVEFRTIVGQHRARLTVSRLRDSEEL